LCLCYLPHPVYHNRDARLARFELENGRPVITRVSGHTLLGDTTPQWQEQ